ncbi:MAG: HAD-IA family hydrolase [Candidatus Coatesbacteria bacterium]|nr:HAD-IA family hydrolase [Candidatus Coatesbacteria bacterium]
MAAAISDIRAIFFDLDGTLTDYEASVDHAMTKLWEALRDECPLPLDEFLKAQWEFLVDLEYQDVQGKIPRNLLKDRKRRTELFLNGLRPGLASRFEDVGKLYTKFREEGLTLYPGMFDVLTELKKAYELGVITEGAGRTQRKQLIDSGIIELFDHIVISDEVELHKPDLALYRKACELAGAHPTMVALVGDRLDWDIVPAKQLGMMGILSRQQAHYRIDETCETNPDYTIKRAEDLLTIFPRNGA